MWILLFLCYPIVPVSYGTPVDKIARETNSTILMSNLKLQSNDTKKTVASEGGAIIPNTDIVSLPKENSAFLMSSAVDISSNKVKARKGAPLEGLGNISTEQIFDSRVNEHFNSSANVNITVNNTTMTSNSSLPSLEPTMKKIYKPTILSADMIAKADLLNSDPAVDDVDERMIKIHKTNNNSHPGMITPIVITVLVVPIFAMIGYMALKRGQEAWKNRHYKRMDFLLDGMYND